VDHFRHLFSSEPLPPALWVPIVSDILIALAFYSIPLMVLYFFRKRPFPRHRGKIVLFVAFLLACGSAFLLAAWNVWHHNHGIEGVLKAVTAILSVASAVEAAKLAPALLRIPTPEQMDRAHQNLLSEVRARADAEARLRKIAESARLSSEAQMRSYLEAASQGMIAVNGRGVIVLVNRRLEEIFGYSREEMLGQSLEMLLPGRFRSAHGRHRESYFAEPRVRLMGAGQELAGRRKDGSEFPVEIGLSFTESDNGMMALGLVTDITERKRTQDDLAKAHAELRASEATLRSYLESAPQAVIASAQDGRIILVNRRAEQMFGYARSELLGQDLELLIPEKFRDPHRAMRADYFAHPEVRAMESRRELTARSKQGLEFPVEIGLSYVPTESGLLALSLVSDISDRRMAANELARVNAALRRSNAELEQFAYVASHDLQEPLRMITSYLDLLRRRYADRLDADAQEFIRYAADGATRMKGLIQDVLSFSRVGTRPVIPHRVSVREITKAALENLQPSIAASGAEISVGELPEVVGDAGLLTQVFQNLIGNAIKFSRSDHPKVQVAAKAAASEWVFSVTDNGIGIDPVHNERIFRIFERLNATEDYPGTGVGLAICKKIVERHGGRIWVESQAGQGAVFSFTIPNNPPGISPHKPRE
jgi:PAS domain S-box-containing protein